MPTRFEKLKCLFKPEDSVAIVIVPDPDSIASSMAFKHLIRKWVKTVDILFTAHPARTDNIAMVKLLKLKYKLLCDFDISSCKKLVLLDGQPAHHPATRKLKFDVIIDHHPVTAKKMPKAPFLDIRPDYSANSVIITEYLSYSQTSISPVLATALYYGILTDTNYLRRLRNNKHLEALILLMPKTKMDIIREIESNEFTLDKANSFASAIKDPVVLENTAIICVDEKDQELITSIADFFMRVSGIFTAIVYTVIKNDRLVMTFRTMNKKLDVGVMASNLKKYGRGGGHQFAARAELNISKLPPEYKSLEKEQVVKFISDNLLCDKCKKHKKKL